MEVMKNTKTHDSYWSHEHAIRKRFEPLHGTHQSDVAIIGGGGTTGGSTGHLDAHPDVIAEQLIKSIGVVDARNYVRWRKAAIATIRRHISDTCDFKNVDALCCSENGDDEPRLRKAADSATEIGLEVNWADHLPIAQAAAGFYIKEMTRMVLQKRCGSTCNWYLANLMPLLQASKKRFQTS